MKKVIVYTDGGARGNPGPAGAGFVLCNEKNETMQEYGKYLGENLTNNEAEYIAAVLGLKELKNYFGKRLAKEMEVLLCVDSELIVKQVQGKYKIENEKLQPLFLNLWNLFLDFKSVKIKHIPRSKNKDADRLVNEALDRAKKDNKLF